MRSSSALPASKPFASATSRSPVAAPRDGRKNRTSTPESVSSREGDNDGIDWRARAPGARTGWTGGGEGRTICASRPRISARTIGRMGRTVATESSLSVMAESKLAIYCSTCTGSLALNSPIGEKGALRLTSSSGSEYCMHGFLSSVISQHGPRQIAPPSSRVHRTARTESACQPELVTGGVAPIQSRDSLAIRIECPEYLRRRGLGSDLLWTARPPSSRLLRRVRSGPWWECSTARAAVQVGPPFHCDFVCKLRGSHGAAVAEQYSLALCRCGAARRSRSSRVCGRSSRCAQGCKASCKIWRECVRVDRSAHGRRACETENDKERIIESEGVCESKA